MSAADALGNAPMASAHPSATVSGHASLGVAWVTMSNPRKRNALSVSAMASLDGQLRRFDSDPEVKVIVLRGAGTESFAAGADISEFDGQQTSNAAQQLADETVTNLFASLEALSKPLITMIYGYCLGAGMAVALGADMRIAAQSARFSIPATRLGIGYPVALTEALVRTVGRAHAADILFTGRMLTASEALANGLVNKVVADSDLEGEVRSLAALINANAPLSVRAAKAAIASVAQPGIRGAAQALVATCRESSDAVEGQQAFMQKRHPNFQGA